MKALPIEARTKNVGAGAEFCRWCGNDGYVTVNVRPAERATIRPNRDPEGGYDEVAPCPYCQAGYREEFPVPKTGNAHPTKTPWGADGYWRGAETATLQPLYAKGFHPLTKEENRQRWRDELGPVIGKIPKEIPF